MPTRGPIYLSMALFFALAGLLAAPDPADNKSVLQDISSGDRHLAAPDPVEVQAVLQDSVGRDRRLAALARVAVGDGDTARLARASLRAAGPEGLRAFERAHGPALDAARDALLAAAEASFDQRDPAGLGEPARAHLLGALDDICGQRDCVLSRLYWHTDLEEAVRTARREGKPIVSLRLLGDLRDELSCANSRFFRALLYPDPAVRDLLHQRFVLHWSSERPAPRITIDLGDGNSVVTTITGNSAHFILDHSGRPVDVIPGLYAPIEFVDALTRAGELARRTAVLSGAERDEALARHHQARLRELDVLRTFVADDVRAPSRARPAGPPRAGEAAPIAVSKMAAEAPLLGATGEPVAPLGARLERFAAALAPTLVLSRASLGLMRTQQWRSGEAARDASEFATALDSLRRTLVLDTLRNEQEIHREIHGWWASGAAAPLDLRSLVRRVYDELFLTPRSDPWLGLADPTSYAGLVGGGRRSQVHL